MKVYVLSHTGAPLMPTTPRKARKLLEAKRARVVDHEPFTIQLLYGSYGYKQPVSLGVDLGSVHVGLSATTVKAELFSGEFLLRNDIKPLLATRAQLRKHRTLKNKRRTKRRWKMKPEGWLPPSVRHKLEMHVKIIRRVTEILPVSLIRLEVAAFDTHRLKNPDVEGEGYQHGEMEGFWNVREYVLYRDHHRCQHCFGESGCATLEVHHIFNRRQGSNAPHNLITLCTKCHKLYHQEHFTITPPAKRINFRSGTFMALACARLPNMVAHLAPKVEKTYGYITKNCRIVSHLPKTHRIDAFVIAGNFDAQRNSHCYLFSKVRRHNRRGHIPGHRYYFRHRLDDTPLCRLDRMSYYGFKGFIAAYDKNNKRVVLRDIRGEETMCGRATIDYQHRKLKFVSHVHRGMLFEMCPNTMKVTIPTKLSYYPLSTHGRIRKKTTA